MAGIRVVQGILSRKVSYAIDSYHPPLPRTSGSVMRLVRSRLLSPSQPNHMHALLITVALDSRDLLTTPPSRRDAPPFRADTEVRYAIVAERFQRCEAARDEETMSYTQEPRDQGEGDPLWLRSAPVSPAKRPMYASRQPRQTVPVTSVST